MADIAWWMSPPSKAVRLSGGGLRDARPRLAVLAETLRGRANRLPGLVARLRRLWMGVDIVTRAEIEERRQDLVSARLDAAHWKAQAGLCAARIAELEAEAADAKVVAMDLRARLVCLHGKLATTAATARYQSYAQALETRPR